MCLYPKLIKNRKYMANKKNGGDIPAVLDQRVLWVPVGCGKCMECRKQKTRQWQVRLTEDIRENKNGKFVTFTFSDEELNKLENEIKDLKGYERDNEVCRLAVRRYTERWRKKYKKTVRHWLVTEIGTTSTERVHLHGIIWHNNKEDIVKIWKYGGVYIGSYVSDKTINYIVKYLNKTDKIHKEYKPKMFASQGIGKNYLNRKESERNKYSKNGTVETYKNKKGYEMGLPIYWRNHIYNEEEREKLWIEKLDKQERWVDGEKVDISKGDKEYYKLLAEERRKKDEKFR